MLLFGILKWTVFLVIQMITQVCGFIFQTNHVHSGFTGTIVVHRGLDAKCEKTFFSCVWNMFTLSEVGNNTYEVKESQSENLMYHILGNVCSIPIFIVFCGQHPTSKLKIMKYVPNSDSYKYSSLKSVVFRLTCTLEHDTGTAQQFQAVSKSNSDSNY